MSRRDSLLQHVDSATQAARARYNAGRTPNGSTSESLGSQLNRSISGLQGGINALLRPVQPATSSGPYISAAETAPPRASTSTAPASTVRTGPPAADEDEELPGYSRRGPGQSVAIPPDLRGQALTTKEHRIVTKNGKLEVGIESVGRSNFPVFIRGLADTIRGDVTMRLEKSELITRVQVRLKLVVRSTVHRSSSGNHSRHPIVDEHLLLELSQTLYECTSPSDSDAARIQGVQTWPYEFRLPDGLRFNGTEMPLPPSFALAAADPWQGTGFEVASVKYYVKCTLARSGLFRPNDRLFAPIIFLQRHERPEVPFARAASLEGLSGAQPLAGPAREPHAWQGRNIHQDVRKGIFSGKRGAIEAVLLLPKPAIFGTRTPIPFYLRISTSESNATGTSDLTRTGSTVDLVQRTSVIAQGVDAVYETKVGTGVFAPDQESGSPKPGEVRFRGVIQPTTSRTPSFTAASLQVGHVVLATFGDLSVAVPCSIQAWPPLRPPALDAPAGTAPDDAGFDFSQAPELPPSYFEVVESDRKQ